MRGWFAKDTAIYDGTVLAEVDGGTAGYIQLSGPERPVWKQTRILFPLLIRHYGLAGGLVRLTKLWISEWSHSRDPEMLYVYMIGVDRRFRRRGIAWKLLDYAIAEGRRRGKGYVKLGVVDYNDGAIALYRKYGFEQSPWRSFPLLHWATGVKGYYDMVYGLRDGERACPHAQQTVKEEKETGT
jgi:ribosomal protein S18 acetylase RimI-like enzyme